MAKMLRSVLRRRKSEWRGLELWRRFSSYPMEPLDRPIPGLANPDQGAPDTANRRKEYLDCKITRLDNGLRVASQEAFGQYSTVGGGWMVGVSVT